MYDNRRSSLFVEEFLKPEKVTKESYVKHPNANKEWTRIDDNYLKNLRRSGSSIKYIAAKMGTKPDSCHHESGQTWNGMRALLKGRYIPSYPCQEPLSLPVNMSGGVSGHKSKQDLPFSLSRIYVYHRSECHKMVI